MSQRSRPEDIEYRLRLKYASEFNYATSEHVRKDVEAPNYFHNISQRYLMVGDLIHVGILHADGTSSKGVFEVVKIDADETVVDQIVPWRSVTGKITRKAAKPLEPSRPAKAA